MAMFLYPLWILFIGALAVLLARSNTKRGLFPSLLSFFVITSSTLVLIPYVFFGRPRAVAGPGGLFLFTLEPLSTGFALCLSIIGAGHIIQLAGWSSLKGGNGKEGASALFGLGLAMGTVFSSDLLTMAFFAEAACLFFFMMVKKRSQSVCFSVVHDVFFFLPTAVIAFMLIFQGMTGGLDQLHTGNMHELSCLFLGVYILLRLFLLPFSFFPDAMAGIFREPMLAGLAVFALFASVIMTVRALSAGPGVAFAVFMISSMVAGIYSVMAYRQRDFTRLVCCIFIVETACIAGAAGLHSLMSASAGRGLFLMICNHFTAATGAAFTAVMMQRNGGRVPSAFFIVFMLALVGLLPCAGLAGKILLYREAFREGGNVATAALVPAFFSVLPVLFFVRWFGTVKKGLTAAGARVDAGQAVFLAILAANLYLPFLYAMK